MITQMKKYTFLVFHRDYEPFLEQLRELGVVHITQKAAGLIKRPCSTKMSCAVCSNKGRPTS